MIHIYRMLFRYQHKHHAYIFGHLDNKYTHIFLFAVSQHTFHLHILNWFRIDNQTSIGQAYFFLRIIHLRIFHSNHKLHSHIDQHILHLNIFHSINNLGLFCNNRYYYLQGFRQLRIDIFHQKHQYFCNEDHIYILNKLHKHQISCSIFHLDSMHRIYLSK